MNPPLMSVSQLFSEAFRLYKARLHLTVPVIAIPFAVLALGLLLVFPSVNAVVAGFVLLFAGVVIALVGVIALFLATLNGSMVSTSYKQALGLIFSFYWIGALAGLCVYGGFVLFLVPGVFIAVSVTFAGLVFFTEGKRGLAALLQSKAYVEGYWWGVFGRLILLSIATSIFSSIVGGVFGLIFDGVIGAFVRITASIFIAPFSVAYTVVLFQNLRSLKPALASVPGTKGKGFLVATAVLGLLVPLVLISFVLLKFAK